MCAVSGPPCGLATRFHTYAGQGRGNEREKKNGGRRRLRETESALTNPRPDPLSIFSPGPSTSGNCVRFPPRCPSDRSRYPSPLPVPQARQYIFSTFFFSCNFFVDSARPRLPLRVGRRIKHTGLMHRYKYNAAARRALREINYATYLRRCDAVRRDRGPRAAKMRRDRGSKDNELSTKPTDNSSRPLSTR